MPNYRRSRIGSTYFFTVVTYRRRPILCLDASRVALRQAIADTRRSHPFAIVAWVLLPDHLHCIWELPEGGSGYSVRWAMIKKGFTQRVKGLLGAEKTTASRRKHREGDVWQQRFWEHTVRDEQDFASYCDYIHCNPAKHGLVAAPRDWPYSTFHRFVAEGVYAGDWGVTKIRCPEGVGQRCRLG